MDLDLKNHLKEDYNMIDQMNKLDHYKILADIFRYPDENLGEKMIDFQSLVSEQFPEQVEKVNQVLDAFQHNEPSPATGILFENFRCSGGLLP